MTTSNTTRMSQRKPKERIHTAPSSPASSPVLFVKKGRSLRMYVDYCGLNAGTIKNQYSLLLFQETMAQLCKVQLFTKLDLQSAYNLVTAAEGEEEKTVFRTCFRLFNFLIMGYLTSLREGMVKIPRQENWKWSLLRLNWMSRAHNLFPQLLPSVLQWIIPVFNSLLRLCISL